MFIEGGDDLLKEEMTLIEGHGCSGGDCSPVSEQFVLLMSYFRTRYFRTNVLFSNALFLNALFSSTLMRIFLTD